MPAKIEDEYDFIIEYLLSPLYDVPFADSHIVGKNNNKKSYFEVPPNRDTIIRSIP